MAKMMSSGWVKDGRTKHPLYSVYYNMVERCTNTDNISFHNYGGRGITVCADWLGEDGFRNFCSDVSSRPSSKHSFDRIDNSLGYFPANVRWATRLIQQNNNRRNRTLTWMGEEYTLANLIRKLGNWDNNGVYYSRLRRGWSIEHAFALPVKQRTWNRRKV